PPLMAMLDGVYEAMSSNDRVLSSGFIPGRDQRMRTNPSRCVVRVTYNMTRRSGSGNGRGRSSAAETTLNIVVVAPMPSASVRMATAATPRILSNVLAAERRSCARSSIVVLRESWLTEVYGVNGYHTEERNNGGRSEGARDRPATRASRTTEAAENT